MCGKPLARIDAAAGGNQRQSGSHSRAAWAPPADPTLGTSIVKALVRRRSAGDRASRRKQARLTACRIPAMPIQRPACPAPIPQELCRQGDWRLWLRRDDRSRGMRSLAPGWLFVATPVGGAALSDLGAPILSSKWARFSPGRRQGPPGPFRFSRCRRTGHPRAAP